MVNLEGLTLLKRRRRYRWRSGPVICEDAVGIIRVGSCEGSSRERGGVGEKIMARARRLKDRRFLPMGQ